MFLSPTKPTNHTFLRRVLAVFLTAGISLVHAQNLVTNGGFESGLNTGWNHAVSGGAVATRSLETAQPFAGTNSLKTVVTTLGTEDWRVQSTGTTFTNLGVGQLTRIRFRARALAANTAVRFVMRNTSAQNPNQNFTLTTSWAEYTWNHTTVEASPQLRIQFPTLGTVWLDEIRVERVITPILPNLSIRRQMMDGIGGSIAFNLPHYERLTTTQKDQIEDLLYVDCGIDILRLRTGNSDALNNELAMRAQRNGAKSLITCWSPPASLKSNGSTTSGTLRIVSGQYDYAGFADWWYARLAASTWRHDFISIQNEPSYDPGDKETCRLFANETVPATTSGSASYKKALEAVYNRIKNEPKIPQFIAVDSEDHAAFKTIAPTVSGLSFVNHMGFHNYGTDDFAGVKARYSGNRGWMTEWGQDAIIENGVITDPGIKEDWMLLATDIHDSLVQADASAYLAWRMVHGANTGQVWAMIGVNAPNTTGGVYTVQNAFYIVKHYAKEISAGDQRVEVTQPDFANTNVRVSGYIDSRGRKLTLVAINTATTPADISLQLGGLPFPVASSAAFQSKKVDGNFTTSTGYQPIASFNHSQVQELPAESITTYVLNLSQSLNPYNPALLRIDGIQHLGNQVALTMPSQLGYIPVLWRSPDLLPGSWTKVINATVTESNGQATITDPSPLPGRAFYRVEHD